MTKIYVINFKKYNKQKFKNVIDIQHETIDKARELIDEYEAMFEKPVYKNKK